VTQASDNDIAIGKSMTVSGGDLGHDLRITWLEGCKLLFSYNGFTWDSSTQGFNEDFSQTWNEGINAWMADPNADATADTNEVRNPSFVNPGAYCLHESVPDGEERTGSQTSCWFSGE